MKKQLIIITSIFSVFISCNNSNNGKPVSNEQVRDSLKKHTNDTITKLCVLKANDSAVFKAPNGKIYKVYDRIENDAETNKSNTIKTVNNLAATDKNVA